MENKAIISNSDFCEVCGKPRLGEIIVLGTKRTCRILCDCEAAERDALEEERMAEIKANEIRSNRSAGFTDKRLMSCTFESDDGKNPELMRLCRGYADRFDELKPQGMGLILYGTVGNGKTYAAAAINNRLIDQGRRCLMTNMTRIINHLWNEEDKNAYIDSLQSFDLLIIDDFAAERNTEYMNEKVFEVVDSRYRSGLPIIITTNLTREEMMNPRDLNRQRVFSRLLEVCAPIEVTAADRRIDKAMANASYINWVLTRKENK